MPSIDLSALTPLIAFALWGVVLLFLLLFARSYAIMRKKRPVNSFKPIGDEEGLDRFSRAHMNTLENLPIFTVVYLAALWTGADAPIATLGWIIFGARIAQSLIHLSSGAPNAVRLRAAMLGVQVVLFAWLGIAAIAAANG